MKPNEIRTKWHSLQKELQEIARVNLINVKRAAAIREEKHVLRRLCTHENMETYENTNYIFCLDCGLEEVDE